MQLQLLPQTFAVCQLQDTSQINLQLPLYFFSKTADELSLVCPEADLPAAVLQCERGWRALKICGSLRQSRYGLKHQRLPDNCIKPKEMFHVKHLFFCLRFI